MGGFRSDVFDIQHCSIMCRKLGLNCSGEEVFVARATFKCCHIIVFVDVHLHIKHKTYYWSAIQWLYCIYNVRHPIAFIRMMYSRKH